MKKLLVLLIVIGLAMGAVPALFAGPVHNNGPGFLAEASNTGLVDLNTITAAAPVLDIAAVQIAGSQLDAYNYYYFSPLNPACSRVGQDDQEVIALLGCSRSANQRNDFFI